MARGSIRPVGSASEFVRASFTIAANGASAQAGDLALEYFETANGTWQPLPLSFSGGQWTGVFGPASGFPLTDGATSQFRATFHKGGRYATTASLVGVGSGLVLATSAPLATDVAEIGLTGIANAAGHVGAAVETAMTLSNTGTAALGNAVAAPNNENVRGRFVITWDGGALAPADTSGPSGNCGAESCASPDVGIEYYDAATGTYRPIYNLRQSADGESLYGYFGALSSGGVPVPAAFSGSNLFHTTFKRNTGTYAVTWQVVGISTGTVYAQAPVQSIGIDTGAAASIAIVSGDGGTATVGGNVYDQGDLTVEVRDIGGNPVAGAAVAFNVQPGNGGAGATFDPPAITDANGRTAIHALSNDIAGVFAVDASLSNGVALAQPFALENVADSDASQVQISLVSGDGQTAQVGTDYALPLVAKVTDRFGNVLSGFDVAFFVNGAGATLVNDSGTTDADGLVDTGLITASSIAGLVMVEARVEYAQCDFDSSDANCWVDFYLTNTAGSASSVEVTTTNVSAEVGANGSYTLTAQVRDADGNGVEGVSVTLLGPNAGAGVTPAVFTGTTDAFGRVANTFFTNDVAGPFQVRAVASGADVTSITLENLPGAAAKIVRVSGDGQSTPVGSAFGDALAVRVLDAFDNPVADDAAEQVSFVANPNANGASASVTASVTSGAGGLASTAATANGTAGGYSVVASFNGHDVAFALTNTVGAVTISDVVWVDGGSTSVAYDGSQKSATATVTGSSLAPTFTYNGSTTAPSAAGSYQVIATIDDGNVHGTASAMLTITPAAAGQSGITLTGGTFTYDGSAKPATVNNPNGVAYALAYNTTDGLAPINAGSYTATLTANDPNHAAETLTATIQIGKATGTVLFGATNFSFDGDEHSTTAVIAQQPGNTTACALTGNAITEAGSTTVGATCDGANYTASGSTTLTVSPKTVTIALSGLGTFPYTGTAYAATATVDGEVAGFPATVVITYNGDANPPSNVGIYNVVAELQAGNYVGAPASGTLVIGTGAASTIAANGGTSFSGTAGQPLAGALPSVKVSDAGGHPVAGVAVTFAAAPGNGTLSGATQTTDQNGIATLGGWTLAATPGINTLIASAAGVADTIEFTAEGTAASDALGVTFTDGRTATQVGRALTYTITVGNGGTSNVNGVHVVDALPAELDAVTAHWQCIAINGATCTTSGNGSLDDTVDLPAGSSVVYLLTATVIGEDANGLVSNSVSVTNDGDIITRTDDTAVVLFRDGFELGGDGAEPWPTGVQPIALGTLDATQTLAFAVDAAQFGSLQRATLAQAGDGAFRVEAIRIGKAIYVRLAARDTQGDTASAWSALDGDHAALVLVGTHLSLVGAQADLDVTLARGGQFAVGAPSRH